MIGADTDQTNKQADPVDLLKLFDNNIPTCVTSLLYNLRKLNEAVDPALYETIGIVYKALMVDVPDQQRKLLFKSVLEEVEAVKLTPAAILAFIRFEPNYQLIRTAVWSYLRNRSVSFKDPFVATHDIVSVMVKNDIANRGAVYAGLVSFGDRRVCAVARTIRSSISASEARAFSSAMTSQLNRTTIEFCLEWLVSLVNRNQFEIAVPVVFALSSMITQDSTRVVHDSEYNFGPFGFSSFTHHPELGFQDLLVELTPILDKLSELEKPALNQMIEIFKHPSIASLDELERRKESSRRKHSNRRASDRRIVDILPHIDRRAEQRRGDQRRMEARR